MSSMNPDAYIKCEGPDSCGRLLEKQYLCRTHGILILHSMRNRHLVDGDFCPDLELEIPIHTHLNITLCPECGHDNAEEREVSYCLVNHGDDTACRDCNKCGHRIYGGMKYFTPEAYREQKAREDEEKAKAWKNLKIVKFRDIDNNNITEETKHIMAREHAKLINQMLLENTDNEENGQ